MKTILRLSLMALTTLSVASTVACSGGGSGGSANAGVAGVFAANGDYQGIQTFLTNIRVVDLGSNTPPVDEDCRGDIDVVVDDGAPDVITGSGQCLLVSGRNAASYSIVGGFLNDTDFEGVITIVFSRVTHVLPFSGSVSGNRLVASFSGRTPQVGNLVIDWDGDFSADRI